MHTFRITLLEMSQHGSDSRGRLPMTKVIKKLGATLEMVAADATHGPAAASARTTLLGLAAGSDARWRPYKFGGPVTTEIAISWRDRSWVGARYARGAGGTKYAIARD